MADSKEQIIIDALIARMQTILTTNGYATNAGATVEDSRPNWDENELPAMSIFQGTVEVVDNADNYSKCVRHMPVMIKVFAVRDDDAATAAAYSRNVAKDIHAAIGTDPTFGAVVIKTRPKSHAIEFAEQTFEITGTVVEIEVAYFSQKFNLEA